MALKRLWSRDLARALPSDYLLSAYAAGVLCLLFVLHRGITYWGWHAIGHITVILCVLTTTAWEYRQSGGPRRFWRVFDALVFILVLFAMNIRLVHYVNPHDVDALLTEWERAIGGIAFLQWTMSWATPLTDEIQEVLWFSYFVLPIILIGVLYHKRRRYDIEKAKTVLVLGWIICFVLYFVFPARGPLHFPELGMADPSSGVALGPGLHAIVNSVHVSVARDSFPSGHGMIASLVLCLTLRYRLRRVELFTIPLALGVIVSTLTLRYHYVVDVLAGLALSPLVFWIGTAWYQTYHTDCR
jgi:membrane-associated phospholipid phosphatase